MNRAPIIMLVAGEPSGDLIAADLVRAMRADPRLQAGDFAPRFFGVGGPRLAAEGVDLAFDLTRHAVVGLVEVVRKLASFRRLLHQLVDLACLRRPDVVVCVDFGGFNLRFAEALRRRLEREHGVFQNWRPRLVQYVSPQVWASRPGRAVGMAHNLDLLLCILPFEPAWYALRAPRLRVEFVGHPILDRHDLPDTTPGIARTAVGPTEVLLLPGSRVGELRRHLPVMIDAARQIAAQRPITFPVVLPDERLLALARSLGLDSLPGAAPQVGGLTQALARATLAIASTGTVTLECALFGVPTVALYKTSAVTYAIARRLATVPYLAMPNLLANEPVFPEFIQGAATGANLARAALELLGDPVRAATVRGQLAKIVAQLGGPGASRRAASAIAGLLL